MNGQRSRLLAPRFNTFWRLSRPTIFRRSRPPGREDWTRSGRFPRAGGSRSWRRYRSISNGNWLRYGFPGGCIEKQASGQGPEIRGPIEASPRPVFRGAGARSKVVVARREPTAAVGLIALSIRQIALPRNRMQAIQKPRCHPGGDASRASGDSGRRHQTRVSFIYLTRRIDALHSVDWRSWRDRRAEAAPTISRRREGPSGTT